MTDSLFSRALALITPDSYIAEKHVLTAMLSDERFRFRSFLEMTRKVDLPAATVAKLLVDLGARPNRGSKNTWGLISRVGIGTEPQREDTIVGGDLTPFSMPIDDNGEREIDEV